MEPIVYTGQSGMVADNTGGAAVLDRHGDFLPYTNRIYAQKRQVDADRLKQARQADKDWNAYIAKIKFDDPYAPHQKELTEGLNRYHEKALEFKSQGNNIGDVYSMAGDTLRKEEQNLLNLKAMSEEIKAKDAAIMAELAKDKSGRLNKAHTLKWLEENRKKPIAEQYAAYTTDSPVKTNFHPADVLERVPGVALDESVKRNGVQNSTSGYDRKKHETALYIDLNTPQGIQAYDDWRLNGHEDGTPDEYVSEIADFAESTFKSVNKTIYDKPRQTGSSGSGDSKNKPELVAVSSYSPSFPGEKGKTNYVEFRSGSNQNIKPINFVSNDGATFESDNFTIHPSPDGSGFVVDADVMVRKIEEDDAGNSKPVETKEKKTFWVSNVPGASGNENYQTISDRLGYPLEQAFGGETKNQATRKSISKSELATKAKAAGYSVKEYEKLLREKGITIE